MNIRKLTPGADTDRIKELFLSVFTHDPWNDDWSDTDQFDGYITDLTGNINSLAYGYFDGEKMIALSLGSIRHWYRGTEYYIDEFCVARELQGQGIGTAFLKDIERQLAENGIYAIFLQTERTVPAYWFYKNRGFIEMPDHVSFGRYFD